MIKQIQLRGISRTPSDRLSEDGGLSESLNMYLDTAESAPAFIPQDVTSKLGLPADLIAERVFIHKASNYEIIILYDKGQLFTYISGKPHIIYTLQNENEELQDIASVGNTLILTTNKNIYYLLRQNGEYIQLGSNIPEISCGFVNVDQADYATGDKETNLPRKSTSITVPLYILDHDWGKEELGYKVTNDPTLTALRNIWEAYQALLAHNRERGYLSGQILLRYAVTLYDNTKWQVSAPILLGGALNDLDGDVLSKLPLTIQEYFVSGENTYRYDITLGTSYRIGLHRNVDKPQKLIQWKDVIKSIDIYATPEINLYPNGNICARLNSDNTIDLDPLSLTEENIEKTITSYGVFYKIKSFSLDEFLNYSQGKYLTLNEDLSDTTLNTSEQLDDYSLFEEMSAKKILNYNNSLMLVGPQRILSRGLPVLNGQHASKNNAYTGQYIYRFYIRGGDDTNIVYSHFISGQAGSYYYVYGNHDVICEPYAFLSYPNSNCYKVDIATYNGNKMLSLEMKRHPVIPNCAYAWTGLFKKTYGSGYNVKPIDTSNLSDENRVEDASNKLLLSMIDNPFVFPIAKRYTFQSKVIGVAIASVALSQGQFGQFPLYVFTEDGIWAMETGADGSFISQKPLSREVCTNPDSITSIDNAVVFVTDKGVMMIQGSQVMNISPYMNGRHYIPNDSATNIIVRQEGFSEFENAIKDETPFVVFMKKAKIAYDYAGQRLICIADDETFQYVYKIDTQTWHKMAFDGFDLKTPLNSYPECFVQGNVYDIMGNQFFLINTGPIGGDASEVAQILYEEARIDLSLDECQLFLNNDLEVDITHLGETERANLLSAFDHYGYLVEIVSKEVVTASCKIYSLGTILDVDPESVDAPDVAKGILITRPFDLGEPDVYKTIKAIKIRGDYDKENVKYLLQGSDDGRTFYTLSSMRGKSWKMFRLFILADLEPTERISWVDIEYETRFKNRLR